MTVEAVDAGKFAVKFVMIVPPDYNTLTMEFTRREPPKARERSGGTTCSMSGTNLCHQIRGYTMQVETAFVSRAPPSVCAGPPPVNTSDDNGEPHAEHHEPPEEATAK